MSTVTSSHAFAQEITAEKADSIMADFARVSAARFTPRQLKTNLMQYIHKSKYARWLTEFSRRETWTESVGRYCLWFENRFPELFPTQEVYDAISKTDVMPSMRALMTAGPALDRDNAAAFNCSFTALYKPVKFAEIMYNLSCGAGVGFSVERQHVEKLPTIPVRMKRSNHTIIVGDSKDGWYYAFKTLVEGLYKGAVHSYDTSLVRPKGTPLKIFGGRASGPGPLIDLFEYTLRLFKRASGRKLNTLECHDLVCKVADCIVSGGVRRSALISISDPDDDMLRHCKEGDDWHNPEHWSNKHGYRSNANNTAVYDEMPTEEEFKRDWVALAASGTGERGFFNRKGCVEEIKRQGKRIVDIWGTVFGLNPCAEIILRPDGFCNLTEVVIRRGDTLEVILEKVRIASILGTFQATLTDFRILGPEWKKNQEEERLLGVSLTGLMDHEILSKVCDEARSWLRQMRQVAIDTNILWANKLGINPAAAVTCVKPSGTVSQLVDCAPGAHARHNTHYIRNFTIDKTSAFAKFMKAFDLPSKDCYYKPTTTDVIGFPVKAPEGSICRTDRSAVEQLEYYLMLKQEYCDHNPSITVSVNQDEWAEAGQWVYNNFQQIGGVSFFPNKENLWPQLPFEDCDEEKYEEVIAQFPVVNWDNVSYYEEIDETTGSQELACTSGACMIT